MRPVAKLPGSSIEPGIAMAPHFTMPLFLIPIVIFGIWRRVRSQFGLQPIRRKWMIFRIVLFAVFGAAAASFAIRDISLVAGLGGGLVAGAALGLLGLRLSRFQLDPVKGDCYVPNPYVGALVTALFIGRLLWRYAMVFPQLQDPTGATPPIHGPDVGQSPLTLALLGLFVGYYICYFVGLLIHHQRILRGRPEQA